MKIPLSIRQLYEAHVDDMNRLQQEVDQRINSQKQRRWHYESRVKELESFALKVETGRFDDPSRLEDFFACTLVVTNSREIGVAEGLIRNRFRLHKRRPPSANWTHKDADSFPFDDLRLYVSLGQDPKLPPTDIGDVVFEVQIKTFLQHAWGIATHDLIYKTDGADWGRERIAYQIKAMLEHVEISIQEAERLAENDSLKKENPSTKKVRKTIDALKSYWSADALPTDVRRLATIVADLLDELGLELTRLGEVLERERQVSGGELPTNLSPYATVVQSLLREERDKMVELLTDKDRKFKVVVPAEIEFAPEIDPGKCCNAIFIGNNVT